MPKINLSVPHTLGQEEAKRRIANLMADSRARFADKISNAVESWNGHTDTFSFKAMGFSVSGTLEVQAAQILIEMNLPLAAFAIKGRIESEILTHARELLR
jgi:Putative polyhydroxyalkanoic acid system protein (PHA_gran_rgn)